MPHTYKVSFRSGDLSFEIESSDKSWLEGKEKEYLLRLSEKPHLKSRTLTPSSEEKPILPTSGVTINEFHKKYIKAHSVSKLPDMAVFFVYYLQKIQKLEAIRTADIAKCFGDVSYPGYNKLNITDILNRAKRRALVNYVNDIWSLTITGEDFVVNLLTSDSK